MIQATVNLREICITAIFRAFAISCRVCQVLSCEWVKKCTCESCALQKMSITDLFSVPVCFTALAILFLKLTALNADEILNCQLVHCVLNPKCLTRQKKKKKKRNISQTGYLATVHCGMRGSVSLWWGWGCNTMMGVEPEPWSAQILLRALFNGSKNRNGYLSFTTGAHARCGCRSVTQFTVPVAHNGTPEAENETQPSMTPWFSPLCPSSSTAALRKKRRQNSFSCFYERENFAVTQGKSCINNAPWNIAGVKAWPAPRFGHPKKGAPENLDLIFMFHTLANSHTKTCLPHRRLNTCTYTVWTQETLLVQEHRHKQQQG